MVDFIVAGLRASIKHIHNKFGKTPLVGAEVGVFRGQHAQCILNTLNMGRLYLIDPWEDYQKWEGDHTAGKWSGKGEKVSGEEIYQDAHQRFKDRENITILKMPSLIATKCFKTLNLPDDELDFIYIDGEHSYAAVYEDLHAWWPIVKTGGVLAGHDYNMGAVKIAVDEFAKEMNIKIQTGYGADFWIDK